MSRLQAPVPVITRYCAAIAEMKISYSALSDNELSVPSFALNAVSFARTLTGPVAHSFGANSVEVCAMWRRPRRTGLV
jgi:hypothetical protein